MEAYNKNNTLVISTVNGKRRPRIKNLINKATYFAEKIIQFSDNIEYILDTTKTQTTETHSSFSCNDEWGTNRSKLDLNLPERR